MFKLRKIVITFEWKVKELLEVWLDIYKWSRFHNFDILLCYSLTILI